MKILAVVPYLYDTSPGQRYRIEQWEKLLRARGLHFTFVPFENRDLNTRLFAPGQHGRKARALLHAMTRRAALPRLAGDFDAVYLYREAALVGGAWFESLLHRAGVPIVYDFDDAIYLPAASDVNRRFAWLKSPRKVAAICRLASHVIVGNSHLAAYAREHNANVSIVPSTIDLEQYDDTRFGPNVREANAISRDRLERQHDDNCAFKYFECSVCSVWRRRNRFAFVLSARAIGSCPAWKSNRCAGNRTPKPPIWARSTSA